MRIFAGIPCPRELLPHAERLQGLLSAVPGIEPLSLENLHLTVIPPWDERKPEAVIHDLRAISSAPFEMSFVSAGYGPHDGAPTLSWMLGERNAELDLLWLQSWRALWSQDPPKPAFPHVTLAKFPERSVLPALSLEAPVRCMVDRVALYEFVTGGRYHLLGERVLGR